VGQERVKGALGIALAAAARARRGARPRPARRPARPGKTSLAYILREELDVGSDDRRPRGREEDIAAISRRSRGDVLFVDEITG